MSVNQTAPTKKQVTFTGSPEGEANSSKQSTPAQSIAQGTTPRFSDKRKFEQRQQNNNTTSIYRVNMDVIELFLDYSIDNDQHEVKMWRKSNRKKQMKRRIQKLQDESKIKSDITAEQISHISQNLAESRVTESIKQELITSNESRVISVDGSFREQVLTQSNEEEINQDASLVQSQQVQDISESIEKSKDFRDIISDSISKDNINAPPIEIVQLDQSQAPAQQVSILKQPTGVSDSLKKQFRKQVSISEEPRKINNQSEDNMKSFKSISVESMSKTSNKNSIISEEDSAFEDTPAANKGNKKAKAAKMNVQINGQTDGISPRGFQNHVQVIQDNYQPNKKDKQKRSFANTKKSISNSNNNIVEFDKPKGKIHRQHTQDRTKKNESPLPSYDGYIAEDSYTYNQSRNRGLQNQVQDINHTYNSTQKKQSVIQGSNSNPVRISLHKLKKQSTQDEKKQSRGRQKIAHNRNKNSNKYHDDSRNESLGFTSDHQLDHLSVNFGRFKRNDGSTEGRDNLGISSVISDFSKNQMGKGQTSFGQDQKEVFLALSKQKDHLVKNYENRSNTFSQNVMSNYDGIYRSEEEIDEQREHNNFSGPTIKKGKKKYFKTPYKVLCVNQLKQKDRGFGDEKLSQSPQPVRLFQAENALQINAVYKKKKFNRRRSQKAMTRVPSTSKRGPIIHQDQRSGSIGYDVNATFSNDLSSPQRVADEQKILDKQLRVRNLDAKSKERLLAEPQSSITVGRQKERAMRNSMTGLVNDSRAVSNYTNNRSLKNNSYAGVNFSSKFTTSPKNESGKRRHENDFKYRFYDQLIQHLDKRIQNINGQLHHVRKQKDIFSIYGQELKPITFGNTPYTISAGVMNQESRQSSPQPEKNKCSQRNVLKKQKTQTSGTRGDRLSSLDAENMQPLGEILKQKQRYGRKDNSMVNDSIYSMNKQIDPEDDSNEIYDFNNDKIIAESARVNTGFILQSSDLLQKVVTERSDEHTRENVTPKSNLLNGQEVDNWNQIVQWGNQGLPFTEIKLLEDMQNSYFKQIETDQIGSQEKSYGDQKILAANKDTVLGNNSNPDLLTQIVSLTQRMGYSHLQLKLLREKQGQLLEAEFELSKEYKLQKIKIKPNKFIFEMSSNMAALQTQQNKERIRSFYPEVEPPRSLIVEQKMGNISQLNKEYYKNKINNYKANKMGFRNTAIIQSCKSTIKPLQSINMNNTQASINMKITQSNIKAESVDIESVEDYYGKKINMRRSIEQRMTYDAKQFKTNKKQKLQEKQHYGKFKQKGSVCGKLNFEEDIIAAEKLSQKEKDEIERGRNSSMSNSPDRNKNFVKKNINNLGPLGSSYDIGHLRKDSQITPQNLAKKQSLIPLNEQRHQYLESIKSMGRTQKISNNMAITSIPKNQDLIKSLHKTSKSNVMNSNAKNSKIQLIKSGQSILANNGLKHQKEPYLGSSLLSTSNSQLKNQYINNQNASPRMGTQIESEKSLQKRLNVLQSAQRQIEADKLRSMGERQPKYNYTQIARNTSGKQNNLLDYHGIGKMHNIKQAQILKGVLTNQRHLQKYIENTSVSPHLDQNSSSGYLRNQGSQGYGYNSNGSVEMRAQINMNSTSVIEPPINSDLRHLGNNSQPQQQMDLSEIETYANVPAQ